MRGARLGRLRPRTRSPCTTRTAAPRCCRRCLRTLRLSPPPSPLPSSSSPPQPAAISASTATSSARTLNNPRFLEINCSPPPSDGPDEFCTLAQPCGGRSGKYPGKPRRHSTLCRRTTLVTGRSGGIGRRAGLKIRFPSGSGGSIPPFGIPQASGTSSGFAAAWIELLRRTRPPRPACGRSSSAASSTHAAPRLSGVQWRRAATTNCFGSARIAS